MDAGGFTGDQPTTWEARALFLLEMAKERGTHAVTLGPADARLGLGLLRGLAGAPGSPLVSANLEEREGGGRLFPAVKIVDLDGVRVGVTAVTLPPPGPDDAGLAAAGLAAGDPERVLAEVLPGLRERCDVLVLLAHVPLPEARRLAARFDGTIDVVVHGGSRRGRGPVGPEEGGAVFLTAGDRGQALGVARIALGADGRAAAVAGDEIVLSREVPGDPEVAALVETFERTLNEVERAARPAADRRAVAGGHYYLGATECAACHRREFEIWSETPHAEAFATLERAGAEALPECFRCHVTGHGDAAGYAPVFDERADLVDVQCEVCHDQGSRHARDGTYGASLLMRACARCHDPENSPDFDPEVYWLMIEH